MKKLLALSGILMLFACGRSILVSEIEAGKNLHLAVSTSVEEFFVKRMSNKTRKTDAIAWQILHQTEEYVYYGFPKQKSDDNTVSKAVEQLFKVNKQELAGRFPGYESITGESVGYNLYLAIEEHRKTLTKNQFEITALTWSAVLGEKSIEITATCQVKFEKAIATEKYVIDFDKKSFVLLAVKKLS